MTTTVKATRATRVDEVLELVGKRLAGPQREVLERFVARYFRQVDPEDLEERSPDDLYGAALSHWNFARRREAGQARVRVFNPSSGDGWQRIVAVLNAVTIGDQGRDFRDQTDRFANVRVM